MSGFSRFFSFYRVFGCFLAMGVQKHNKDKRSAKKIVSKSFYKKLDEKSKTIFFLILYHVFGRFSVRGVQKHDKKYHTQKI